MDAGSRLPACERRWGVSAVQRLGGGFRAEVFACRTPSGDELVVKGDPCADVGFFAAGHPKPTGAASAPGRDRDAAPASSDQTRPASGGVARTRPDLRQVPGHV